MLEILFKKIFYTCGKKWVASALVLVICVSTMFSIAPMTVYSSSETPSNFEKSSDYATLPQIPKEVSPIKTEVKTEIKAESDSSPVEESAPESVSAPISTPAPESVSAPSPAPKSNNNVVVFYKAPSISTESTIEGVTEKENTTSDEEESKDESAPSDEVEEAETDTDTESETEEDLEEGENTEEDPAEEENEEDLESDDLDSEEGQEEADNADDADSEEEVPLNQSVTLDGVVISVVADAGVFPEGAFISVRTVHSGEENQILDVIGGVRQNKNILASYTFDITVYDKDGNEIQPNTEKGSVKVSFQMAEIANANLKTAVYHIKETAGGLDAEGLSVGVGKAGEAVVETTGFSYYTVEFTYGELQYVLKGNERVALSEILASIGISGDGNIEIVEGSNNNLFKPVQEEGVWYIEAVQAFSSKEWLKVTIDGVTYEIVVTDEQGAITSWEDLKIALADSSEATITLQGDVTALDTGSGTLEVKGTKTLDLNGYVINADNKKFRVFNVTNGATLTLKDSNPNSTHTGLPDGGVITGGDTTNNQNIGGSGINIESGATFNMEGGTIYNNKGFWTNNEDFRYNNGGGVRNAGTFNMSGGAIKNNQCKYGAGVLLVDQGTFIMSGGSITENRTHNQGNGAGVYLKGGTFKMTGGVIKDNKSSWSGGGVYVPDKGFVNTQINIILGGTAQIYDNIGYQDRSGYTTEHNLYIQPQAGISDSIINIATGNDSPKDGMNVHVLVPTSATNPTATKPIQITHANDNDYSQYFTPDNTSLIVGNLDENKLYVGIPLNITNATPESSKDTNNGYIKVDKSQAIYQEEVNVTVHSNPGYVLESLKFNDADIAEDKKFKMPESAVTVTANFKEANDVTVHFNNGLYDGFAPYWKVDTTPSDDALTFNSEFSLPSNFKNVGYTLAGWTTTAPTAGSTSSATYTGATMTVDQVNALYEQSRTSGEVTLYAVWERDDTNTAWNANQNKLYGNNGLRLAIEDTSLQDNDVIYILQDHELTDSNAKYLIKKNNIVIDGGVYKYQDGSKVSGARDETKASHGNHTRYTIKLNGKYNGHTFEYIGATNATFQNLVFTKGSSYPSKSNGFFWLNGETGASRADNETLTLKNVEIHNLGVVQSESGTALIGAGQNTAYLILEDCYFYNNTSEGGIFVAGRTETRTSGQGNGDTVVTLKGNTRIINNKINNVEMNIKIETPVNTQNGVHLHIDDSFTGQVGVYLPTAQTLIGALCKDRARAISLINNGNITSDQSYELAPLAYDYSKNGYTSNGAIRIAQSATLTFNTNGSTSGSLPTKAIVDGNEINITNNVLNIYLGAEVTLPGAGTLAKDNLAFAGWNTNVGGTGTDYISGATYTVSETDTTLYAVWKEHNHSWKTFIADGKLITYCTTPGCKYYAANDTEGKTKGLPLTISGITQPYTGNPAGINLGTPEEIVAWNSSLLQTPTIAYRGRGTTTYIESQTPPTEAGTYTAIVTIDGKTTEIDFEITKAPQPTPPSGGYYPTPEPPTAGTISGETGDTTGIYVNASEGNAVVLDIPGETIEAIAKTEVNGEAVVIDVSGTGKNNEEISAVTVPKTTIEKIVEQLDSSENNKEALTIKSDGATVTMDHTAITSILDQATGNDILLVVKNTEEAKLNVSQKNEIKTLSEDPNKEVLMTFEAYFVSGGSRISNFNGGLVTIGKIDFKIPKGKNPNFYHIYYIPENGKAVRYKTWADGDTLYFSTTHFSDYAIIYEETVEKGDETTEPEDTETPSQSGQGDKVTSPKTGDTNNMFDLIFIMLALMCIAGIMLVKRENEN